MVYWLIPLSAFGWFFMGWVGGILLKKNIAREGKWVIHDENVTRFLIIFGPITLSMGLASWIILFLICRENDKSWFL